MYFSFFPLSRNIHTYFHMPLYSQIWQHGPKEDHFFCGLKKTFMILKTKPNLITTSIYGWINTLLQRGNCMCAWCLRGNFITEHSMLQITTKCSFPLSSQGCAPLDGLAEKNQTRRLGLYASWLPTSCPNANPPLCKIMLHLHARRAFILLKEFQEEIRPFGHHLNILNQVRCDFLPTSD